MLEISSTARSLIAAALQTDATAKREYRRRRPDDLGVHVVESRRRCEMRPDLVRSHRRNVITRYPVESKPNPVDHADYVLANRCAGMAVAAAVSATMNSVPAHQSFAFLEVRPGRRPRPRCRPSVCGSRIVALANSIFGAPIFQRSFGLSIPNSARRSIPRRSYNLVGENKVPQADEVSWRQISGPSRRTAIVSCSSARVQAARRWPGLR